MSGDIWGIPGPLFLAAYLLLAVGVGGAAWANRRRTLGEPGREDAAGWETPERVAYLNGGRDLALTVALSNLYADGLIMVDGKTVQRVESRKDEPRSALERAVLGETARQVGRRVLIGRLPVRLALAGLRHELVDHGLVVSFDQHVRARRWAWATLGVLVLGLARHASGLFGGQDVSDLIAPLVGVAVATVLLFRRLPFRATLGDDTLAKLRIGNAHLAPELRPSRETYGPSAVAMGVALYGEAALWAAHPEFATEMAVPTAGAGSDGGSSCGGSCGSCGSTGSGGGSCGGGGGGSCGGGCGGGN